MHSNSVEEDGVAKELPALPPRLARVAEQLNANEDFPAMSVQILKVMNLADREREGLRTLTHEILKDVALTNKLLRVVNAARFAGHKDGVGTVSRAISLMGVSAVQQLALSLVLLEHLDNKHQVHWLQQVYLKTLLSAHLAVSLTTGQVEPETAFLTTMFQSLGPVVALSNFPEVAAALDGEGVPEYEALQKVTRQALGVSLDELSGLIASMWSLPDNVKRAMSRPEGQPPARPPQDAQERLRWTARAASEMADLLFLEDKVDEANVERTVRGFLPVLGQTLETATERIAQARVEWVKAATALGLQSALQRSEKKQGAVAASAPKTSAAGVANSPKVLTQDVSPEMVLTQGLDDLTSAMMDGGSAQERARIGLEAICRALGLTRAVLCRRHAGAAGLQGWVGLGDGSSNLCRRIELHPERPEDNLSKLSATGRDTWVPDVRQAAWISRLPDWLPPPKQGGFLLMPLHQGNQLVGVIYADGTDGRILSAEIPGRTLLQSLRRLLIMAAVEPSR